MPGREKKSLGEQLLEQGVISQQQWQEAQLEEKNTGQPLRKILIRLGMITEEDMVSFIAKQMGIPHIDLKNYLIDSKIIDLIPEDLARKHQLIPVLKIGRSVTCAMADPLNIFALDELKLKTGLTIEPAVATEQDIKKAVEEHYSVKGSMDDVIQALDEEKLGIKDGVDVGIKQLEGIAEEPPVIKLVNMMVMLAVHERASDIHIEPEEDRLSIRFRIDGMLYDQNSPPKHFQSAIISRIKVLSNLDISERRRPQDGRFQMRMENRQIDIRVSCVPTVYGENVVMRLLDTSNVILGLEKIGIPSKMLDAYKEMIHKPYGMILISGPTGSGKTTTLYSFLNTLNTSDKNIITIEDPVEYHLPGVRQMQVNPEVDLTFANGLRSILRQDPDIIMVGEIRDRDTAEIAIQAALTGHLVFSTLHTNDAPSAIARLIDMGIEPFLISSSLIGIVAQRLVRVLCQACQGKGCDACSDTGYKGRTGIYELMIPNEKMKQLTTQKASAEEMRKAAVDAGMKTLREDGMQKVKQGITSQEEVVRVTQTE